MRSISKRRRKSKRLGEPIDWSAIDFQSQPIDTQVELIRALIPLGLMAMQEMLEAEVCALVGTRYGRGGEVYRHGTNPGSVKLQGQRHPVRMPRVRRRQGQEVSLQSWTALKHTGEPDEAFLGVLRAAVSQLCVGSPSVAGRHGFVLGQCIAGICGGDP